MFDKQQELFAQADRAAFPGSWKDDQLTIIGKLWVDSYSNTYHTVSIYHGKLRVLYTKAYGPNDQYIITALNMLNWNEDYFSFHDKHLFIRVNVRNKKDL